MKNVAQTRILAVVLAVATVAACVLAAMNFEHESGLEVPTDGIWWVEASGGLRAERVPADSPGNRAGIRTGDILISVNDQPTTRVASLGREMFHTGSFARATYSILRPVPQSIDLNGATRLDIPVILGAEGSVLQPVSAIYCAGLSLHRDLRSVPAMDCAEICSFLRLLPGLVRVLQLPFDGRAWHLRLGQYGGAGAAAGAVSALRCQLLGQPRSRPSQPVQAAAGLCPAVSCRESSCLALQYTAIRYWSATEVLVHRLDQISLGYLALYYVIAAIVFRLRYRRAESGLERQQLKWLTRGTLLAVTPFTLLNVIPYLADWSVPAPLTKLAGLSLVILPLTFSWAIVRYRLMDVDLIFKRGVTYTLATASLVGFTSASLR